MLSRSAFLLVAIAAVLALCVDASALDMEAARRDLSRSGRVWFNRVEGLFIGYRLGVSPHQLKGATVHAETGYGFDSKEARWETGLTYRSDRVIASLTAFDRTETNDALIVGTGENSIFSALFKWDYRDYYRTKNGFELKGSYRLRPRLTVLSSLSGFSYETMAVKTDWGLLYPDRAYRVNPAVREGDVGLFRLGLTYDSRRGGPLFRNSWVLSGSYRRAFREFDHNALALSATRFQKTVFGNQAFIVSARITSVESTAEQFLYDLGGVGTLRGFEIKEFTGNRMVLLTADYLFRGDVLNHVPIRGFDLVNLILFADTGWLTARPRSGHLLAGFGSLSLRDFKTDAGVSIALPRQIFRFDVARRLDRKEDPWVLSARIRYEF